MADTQTTRSNRLSRFVREPKKVGGMVVTDRDRAILYDLYHHHFLPTSLIAERHFQTIFRARHRLKLLFHHGYVTRAYLPTVGANTSEAIYSLDKGAIPELATCYGLAPEAITRRVRKKIEPFFVEHRLLVTRIRMRLGSAGSRFGIGLYDWRDDDTARMTYEGFDRRTDSPTTMQTLVPDGMGWVKSRKARFAFCLEADRGTMSRRRMRTKFERYRDVATSGVFTRHFGAERFRVLVTAPGPGRAGSLRKIAEAVGGSNVWLTTEAGLSENVVLAPIWQRAGHEGRFSLFTRQQVFDATETPAGRRWVVPERPDDEPQPEGGSDG